MLQHATSLVVHSRTVAGLVRGTGYEGRVAIVPHPAWSVPEVAAERRGDGLVIGCFGVVNSSKRIPELLRAFASVRKRHSDATLLLVGPTAPASTSTVASNGSESGTVVSFAKGGLTSADSGGSWPAPMSA